MRRSNFFRNKRKLRQAGGTREQNGYTMAEFGPTLMLAFVVFVFPMLAVGQLGMRYLFLMNITENAAESAAKSESFKTDNANATGTGTTSYNYSAVTTGSNVSQLGCKSIGGGSVSWVSTDTYIYVAPLGAATMTTPGPNTVLSAAADPTSNTYNCVVKTRALLAPLFPGAIGLAGKLPGFNTPIDVTCQSSRVFESTADLTD